MLEALRAAQERTAAGSPGGTRQVADALDVTPAYTSAIASFYDMLHLEPVGAHLVEVCTNLSCALVGAQRVVEAFESELGVSPGETTEDGNVTFRTVSAWVAAATRPSSRSTIVTAASSSPSRRSSPGSPQEVSVPAYNILAGVDEHT